MTTKDRIEANVADRIISLVPGLKIGIKIADAYTLIADKIESLIQENKELERKLEIAREAIEKYCDLNHAPKLEEALEKIK